MTTSVGISHQKSSLSFDILYDYYGIP